MSAPAPRPDRFFAHPALQRSWWILLLGSLALLWIATGRRIERVDAISDFPTWTVDGPGRDAASPTGYASGQRRLVVPGHHSPSFWWIAEAQIAAHEGAWRLRTIDYDAPPDGRPLRRTSPYRWWLIAIGWLHGTLNDAPLGYGIERAALIADPILLGLMLAGGALYCARYLGRFAALGFTLAGMGAFPLVGNFQPGAPDPHALAWALALGSVLPLLAAFKSAERPRGGRVGAGHFAAAGVLGGLGFWNDAVTQAPVLLAILCGGAGNLWLQARTGSGPRALAAANGWRSWGLAGALTTLGASVFELAPDRFSWSLDSVSPLHAVAWWGMGEVVRAGGLLAMNGWKALGRRTLVWAALGLAALLAWPVAAIASGTGSLLAPDFYARELANHPDGGLAANFAAWVTRPGNAGGKWATLVPPALLFALAIRTGLGSAPARRRIVFALIAAAFILVLALFQLRWWNAFDALFLAAVAALFAEIQLPRERINAVAATALLLPGALIAFPTEPLPKELSDLPRMELQELVARDFSYWIVKRAAEKPVTLFSTPLFSGPAAHFGGFRVAVSSDDLHAPAQQVALRIISANTEEEISILLRSREITHVALPLWDPTLNHLVRLGATLPADAPLPRNAFAVSAQEWGIPLWMRALNYTLPNRPALRGFDIRALELTAAQEPDAGLARLANLFVARGMIAEARSIRDVLANYPRSPIALTAIANIDLAVRDTARLEQSLAALIPMLSRRSARDLPLDIRISLAATLVRTDRRPLAEEQLKACFAQLDATALRALSPDEAASLVALSTALAIPFPDASLRSAAMELIPADVRDQLDSR